MIRSFQEVLSRAESLPPQRAVILFPHDQAVIRAVKEGLRRKYIDPILVGIKPNIQAVAREVELDLKGIEIIHIEDKQKGADLCLDQAIKGKVGLVIKGNILTTYLYRSLIKATKILNPDHVPCTLVFSQVSGINKLFVITDPGVNIRPDLETKLKMLKSAIFIMKRLGYVKPRVMLLSCKREISTELVSSKEGKRIRDMSLKDENYEYLIDENQNLIQAFGNQPVREDEFPDLFLVPNIDVGNILVKSVDQLFLGLRQAVTVGAGIIILTPSRSDGYEERLLSLAFGKVLSGSG
jgi:phosphate butyryltransferase